MNRLVDHVRAGNEAAARQLLDQQTVELKAPEGGDLLWTAYTLEKKEIAAMLVCYGADLSVRKLRDNRTLLQHILRDSGVGDAATRELFHLMLDHGADIDARDNEGISLLHDAITCSHRGSIELAEELLKRGARITAISTGDRRMNDIYLACKHKVELLPKLIQHQEPDKETRDQRATNAIEYLISENYTGAIGATVLLMIEKILGLGVPVNVPDSQCDKRKMSFLDTALAYKNIAAVELLLKNGADPYKKNHNGDTTLYRATAFQDTTLVCRWLIERGVSIQARNNNGQYPVHGACIKESVKNLHLLLNLGADLSSTDRSGQTPFGLMTLKKKQKDTEACDLVIKYLALMDAKGEKISERDRVKLNKRDWSKSYFEKCIEQLEQMKKEKLYEDTSYFSLLSMKIYSKLQLVKDKKFLDSFKRGEKRRKVLFPDYFYMLLHSHEIAKKKLEVLQAEKKELCEVFKDSMPDNVVEKIAYYLCFEKLVLCNRDYFMIFHAKL